MIAWSSANLRSPLGMPGHQRLLPGVELGVGVAAHLLGAGPQSLDLRVERPGPAGLGELGELLDLGLQLLDGTLELEVVGGHSEDSVLGCEGAGS
jgi:hypothetical protein